MAGLSEEFVTLTQLNCAQQCTALMQGPKPKNYYVAAALFGLYCGVLAYRSYRKYLSEKELEKGDSLSLEAEDVQSYDSFSIEPPPVTSNEDLLTHIKTFANTQIIKQTDNEIVTA